MTRIHDPFKIKIETREVLPPRHPVIEENFCRAIVDIESPLRIGILERKVFPFRYLVGNPTATFFGLRQYRTEADRLKAVNERFYGEDDIYALPGDAELEWLIRPFAPRQTAPANEWQDGELELIGPTLDQAWLTRTERALGFCEKDFFANLIIYQPEFEE